MKHTLFIAAAFAVFSFASCNNAGTNAEAPKVDSTCIKAQMKVEKNTKTVMTIMEGINAHNVDKVFSTGDINNFTDYGDGSMPPMKGDSAKTMLAQYMNSFDMKAENTEIVAEGNKTISSSDWTLTFKNDFKGMKATGKTVKCKDVDIFTFDDNGKVTSHRNIYPSAALMMQMGVDMAKMQAMMGGGDKKK
jgi:predicted ester cyclase